MVRIRCQEVAHEIQEGHVIYRTDAELRDISGTMCTVYMEHFEAALDGKSLAMPTNRHLAEAAQMGRSAAEKYLQDENGRIG